MATVSALVFVSMFVMGYMADWRLLRPKQLSELVVVCGVATGLAWEKSFAWAVREAETRRWPCFSLRGGEERRALVT